MCAAFRDDATLEDAALATYAKQFPEAKQPDRKDIRHVRDENGDSVSLVLEDEDGNVLAEWKPGKGLTESSR